MNKPKPWYFYSAAMVMALTYSAILLIASEGELSQVPQVGFASLFWTGLFFYLWWKIRGERAWRGAVIGIGVGFIAFFACAFIGTLLRS